MSAWRVTDRHDNEPLSLLEAKAHCRIHPDDHDEDDLIGGIIAAARNWIEEHTRRTLINTTYEFALDEFPANGTAILLPRPPLRQITDFVYTDANGNDQGLTADDHFQLDVLRSRIVPGITSTGWPPTQAGRINAAVITYIAGYGENVGDVPQVVRQAMRILVSHWYENREPIITGTISVATAFSVGALLSTLRLKGFDEQ